MQRISIAILYLLMHLSSTCAADDIKNPWKNDFHYQILANRPKIEARYTDALRTSFVIDTEKYKLIFDLKSDSGQRVNEFSIRSSKNAVNILNGNGIYLQLTDSKDHVYSSFNSKEASRVNIYRRGPYYIETHWLDVSLADLEGKTAPVKAEIVFYSYPEKTHVGVILHATDNIEVKNACMTLDFDAMTCASMARTDQSNKIRLNDFCLIKRADNALTCALIYPVPKGVDDVSLEKTADGVRVSNYIYSDEITNNVCAKWEKGTKATAYFELLPLEKSEVSSEMQAEINPLLSISMRAASGHTMGYDPIRGCYKVQTDNPGFFSYHYYENPNAYEEASFSIQNNDNPRKAYILHETRNKPGYLEGGVILDESEITLPVTVQISKNFQCEFEEPFYNPDDTPFSETIFPLYLGEDELRILTSLHLYQNWGTHPLKQFSSLAAWMDYYHMSTGVTETTCYVPFLFAGLEGVSIADLRPMSQRMWEAQPQHDNVAGHSFLRYCDKNGLWHYLEYTGTTFRSTGPNWADMSLSYLSDDGKARVGIDVFELPQTDELRNFMHIRIDFLDDISIKDADFTRNMRILNIASWVQQMRYTQVAYGGPTGDATVVPVKLNDDFTIAGVTLPAENGFATIYPDKKGANAFIVRRFEGKLGGETAAPSVSVYGNKNGDTILMLTPVTKAKEINKGDYLDIDLFIMPYGDGAQDEKPAKRAAFDFGLNAPKVTSIVKGKKLSDFPTRIELDDNGSAEFTVTGGTNYIPIIVEGIKDYRCLRLYNMDGEKSLIDHAQKGERDGYQVFVREDGTFGYVFLVKVDGKEHRYLAE